MATFDRIRKNDEALSLDVVQVEKAAHFKIKRNAGRRTYQSTTEKGERYQACHDLQGRSNLNKYWSW